MLAVRQARALSSMLWRFWARRGLMGRRGSGMRAPGLVLRVFFLMMFANLGFVAGTAAHGHPEAIGLMVLGLAGYAGTAMLAVTLGTVRGVVSPLQAPLLDGLPLHEGARVFARLLSAPQLFVMGAVALHYASPRPTWARDAALGALVVAAALLVGLAASHALRALVPPMMFARATVPVTVAILTSLLVFLEAKLAVSVTTLRGLGALAWPLVGPLAGAGSPLVGGAEMLAVGVGASLVIAWAERRGFDRVDAVPTERYARASVDSLALARIDRVLSAREPGARAVWVASLYIGVLAGGAAYLTYAQRSLFRGEEGQDLFLAGTVRLVLATATFASFTQLSVRAGRAVERDLVARPLLAPLPVAPADLLAGKTAAIRRQAMIIAAPVALLALGSFAPAERLDVLWHVAAVLGGVWIAADALVSVAFLTSGVGAGPRAASAAPLSLDRFLLLLPMLSIATAAAVWVAALGLAALALLAVEARRSARLCVRWLDDEEDFARETAVWRALIVLAAFFAVQGAGGRLAALFALPPTTTLAVVYVAAAIALVALTARERGLGSIALRPARSSFFLVAALAGAGMAAFTTAYAALLPRFGVEPPPLEPESVAPLAFMAVVAAPLAEEVFFRGWLQDAIAREHPSRGGAFAVVVTSFAFAAVHPPLNVVPAFVLGLVTGALARRSGAIGPGILVHAMMNAAGVLAR